MSADSDSERRQRLRDELAQLREAALADLERRGYAVRGKTPAQIRELLRQRPKGAVRSVVGIRRGAISGNMKVSVQAARSIG
jgi:hypothetical protein